MTGVFFYYCNEMKVNIDALLKENNLVHNLYINVLDLIFTIYLSLSLQITKIMITVTRHATKYIQCRILRTQKQKKTQSIVILLSVNFNNFSFKFQRFLENKDFNFQISIAKVSSV